MFFDLADKSARVELSLCNVYPYRKHEGLEVEVVLGRKAALQERFDLMRVGVCTFCSLLET